MQRFLVELYWRDRALAIAGGEFLVLLLVMLVAAAIDDRTVLGVNVWIKPIKFAASIAIYLWTLAWLLGELPGPSWSKGVIRWGAIVAMVAEIVCIAGQSLRGVASHFNHATTPDSAIFSAMGVFIAFNSALEILMLVLFFQRGLRQPAAYLWGIRLGLAGALLSAAVGGLMIGQGAHTVGAPDGGPGLWIVNWSTTAGDLRIAHAVGLHALQVLPLVGYVLSRRVEQRTALLGTIAFAALYLAAGGWLLWQAVAGRSLLTWGGL